MSEGVVVGGRKPIEATMCNPATLIPFISYLVPLYGRSMDESHGWGVAARVSATQEGG